MHNRIGNRVELIEVHLQELYTKEIKSILVYQILHITIQYYIIVHKIVTMAHEQGKTLLDKKNKEYTAPIIRCTVCHSK